MCQCVFVSLPAIFWPHFALLSSHVGTRTYAARKIHKSTATVSCLYIDRGGCSSLSTSQHNVACAVKHNLLGFYAAEQRGTFHGRA